MTIYELPADRDRFLSTSSWDFAVTHEGSDLRISMDEIEGVQEEDELAFLKPVVLALIERKKLALDAAADRLLSVYNETWRQEAAISREEFIRRLKFNEISVDRLGCGAIDFYDNDMFEGHLIVVSFDRAFNIVEVDLVG